MTGAQIDLNCDIGEGFGRWHMPYDAELMGIVTTVNIAAGFHAGDPTIIRATVDNALAAGLDMGVHVALPDMLGFGRRAMDITAADLQDYCTYQIGAVTAFVTAAGGTVTHVKPHGALYAMASRDPQLAISIARAIKDFDASLSLFLLDDRCRSAVESEGVALVTEGFPELHYDDEAELVLERDKAPWEPPVVAERAVKMARGEGVDSQSGKPLALSVQTLCVHSDAPNALEVAKAVRSGLEKAGVHPTALSSRQFHP